MRSATASACVISLITLHLFAQTTPSAPVWESRFRAIPDAANIGEYMKRLSARPHHVGSAYDKENAEFIAAQFRSWGYETEIEQFDVLFPTPKLRPIFVSNFQFVR